jgi:hypothetical protein
MKSLAAALAFGILAACAAAPAPTTAAAPPAHTAAEPAAGDDAAAACAARGGAMHRICRMQSLQCVIRYADAGKSCRGKADCQGRCLAKGEFAREGEPTAGVCQATSNPCGCHTLVEDGRAGPTMCVD